MGPWLVLVSRCFRENVVATCKIWYFLCNLDNLLQKNVIVFFFGNLISKWRPFEKRAIFDLLFTFFSHQGKLQKFFQHTYLTHIHQGRWFCSPYWLSLPYQFWKRYKFIRDGFSLVWVLVLILIRAILEQSIKKQNWEQNLSLNVYYWYVFTLMPNLQSLFCKPRTDGGEDSV